MMKGESAILMIGLLIVAFLGIWVINAADNEPVAFREFSTAGQIQYGIDAGRHVKVNILGDRSISAEFEVADITLGIVDRLAPGQVGIWNPRGATKVRSNSFAYSNNAGFDIWIANQSQPLAEAVNISVTEYKYRTEVLFFAAGRKAVKYHWLDWVLVVPLQQEKMSARIATSGDRYPAYYISRAGEDVDDLDESRIVYRAAFLTGRADWIWVTG